MTNLSKLHTFLSAIQSLDLSKPLTKDDLMRDVFIIEKEHI